jgi:hypothetical protein
MGDMRWTTLVVTVGDYDSGELPAEIRDQVAAGVRSAGFVSVHVEVQAVQE